MLKKTAWTATSSTLSWRYTGNLLKAIDPAANELNSPSGGNFDSALHRRCNFSEEKIDHISFTVQNKIPRGKEGKNMKKKGC